MQHAQGFMTPRLEAPRIHVSLAMRMSASQGDFEVWDAWRARIDRRGGGETNKNHAASTFRGDGLRMNAGSDTWDAWSTRTQENRTRSVFRSQGLQAKNAGQDASLSALINSGEGALDDRGYDDGATDASVPQANVQKTSARGSAFDGPNITAMVYGDVMDLLQV